MPIYIHVWEDTPEGICGAMCTKQSKIPKLTIVREDVSQTSKGFVFSLIGPNESFIGFLREKEGHPIAMH